MIAVIAVVGGDDELEAARGALAGLVAEQAFFDGATVESWSSAAGGAGVVWARSSGVHAAPESTWTSLDRAAFVLGQPIRWVDGRADGIEVLDAARMASLPPDQLAAQLDGRGLLLTVGRDGVAVVGDPMRSYPLYASGGAGASAGRGARSRRGARAGSDLRAVGTPGAVLWVTNVPGLLRRRGRAAAETFVPSRIASAVAYGSSFDGAPWLAGVERIDPWHGGRPGAAPGAASSPALRVHSAAPRLDRLVGLHGRGDIHPAEAGAVLVEVTRAMALRHGADLIVPVSAGKDSRLVLAAALCAELPIRTVTGGAADSADVVVGSALAEAAGVAHERISASQPTRTTHPLETIGLVSRVSEGVVTAGDAHFFPHGPSELGGTWLSGQAGEIARAFYGRPLGPATSPVVLLKAMSRRPGRPLPLTALAEARFAWQVRRRLRELRTVGAGPSTLGDAFYLTDRMGRHLSGALLHFELGLDYASPLWSARLLPHLWSGTSAQRQRSTFHDQVTLSLVAGLAPSTRDAFADLVRGGGPKEAPVEPGGFADAALLAAQTELHATAVAVPADEPIWKALSRRRTLELAERPRSELDFIERQHVWRLATALRSWTR